MSTPKHPLRFFGTIMHDGKTYAVVGGDDAPERVKKKLGTLAKVKPGADSAPLPVLELDVDEPSRNAPPPAEAPREESAASLDDVEARIRRRPKTGRGMIKPDSELIKKWADKKSPPVPDDVLRAQDQAKVKTEVRRE